MPKSYFNNAIIGNSGMLGCLSEHGELIRLFWPNIDYWQSIDRFYTGIFFPEHKNSTLWLHENGFSHRQCYDGDTNIAQTICEAADKGIKIIQTDYVVPGMDVMIRSLNIENIGNSELNLGLMQYSSMVTTTPELASSLFDFDLDSLIHYRHDYYASIFADREVHQFQLGNNAFNAACYTELGGYDNIGMMPEGALSWKLGSFLPGEKKSVNLIICLSKGLKEVKKLSSEVKNYDLNDLYRKTVDYWKEYLDKAIRVNTGRDNLDNLYRRSLLVFKLMADEKTGGLLASAEVDEDFTKCGRYAYCWGRDAAFITEALDKCGLHDTVEKFYCWAAEAQEENGSWQQRYYMDGNLAPSWGLQIDETGTIVWGILRHYKVTGDTDFLNRMWSTVKKAVNFMTEFIDPETGLPALSFDLWEERFGEHLYSSAAVYGGVRAGIEIAGILKLQEPRINKWQTVLEGIRASMEKYFWKENNSRFIRSIKVKLNPWGSENSGNTTIVKVNPKGYLRDVTLEDWKVDISLLGITVPFDVFEAEDKKVENTVGLLEQVLGTGVSEGFKRYEDDNYIGGNPWIISTLWLALYHIKRGNCEKAGNYLEWAAKSCTGLGLLPEQVGKNDGKPVWIIPLTWSHAMFILTLTELIEKGFI
ncbi:MAG: glycoside hydrolase family 15 protein [Bacillota bacterium]|nr:glycoside hydrolase family 15 protein [Bacillota bacterium]